MKIICSLVLLLASASLADAQEQKPTEEPRKKMQFIIFLQPTRPDLLATITPEEQKLVGEHFARYQRLLAEKKIVFVGRTQDPKRLFGIAVVEVDSEAEALEILNEDPAVKGGVQKGEVIPFSIALMQGRD